MFETLGITLSEFQHFLLITARISILVAVLPIISNRGVPHPFKILLGLFLALICINIIPRPDFLPVSFLFLVFYAGQEILIGLLLGLITHFLFEAMILGGFMAGRLMGLSMLSLVDPSSRNKSNAIGQLSTFVAILILFATNGHHFFINAIFNSFYLIPISKISFSPELVDHLIEISKSIFTLAFKFSAPFLAFLFLERVLMALFAKIAPDFHVIIISLPLSLLMGFYIMSIYWPYFNYAFQKFFENYKTDIMTFMKLLGGNS